MPFGEKTGSLRNAISKDSFKYSGGGTVPSIISFTARLDNPSSFKRCRMIMTGATSIAFEIFLQKDVPDWIIIPMGSGELLVSLWKGFNELKKSDIIDYFPKLIGVPSQISAPIVNEFFGMDKTKKISDESSKPIALGIFVKNPVFKTLAIKFIKESGGTVVAIEEESIVNLIDNLIRKESIFAEPASALTLGAVELLNRENWFDSGDNITCLITGSGLKAPYILEAISSQTKTAGKGSIIITKLKILSQISLSSIKGITG